MHRRLTKPLVLLALATALLLGAGGAQAQLQPSSDVLLPYFEVNLKGGGTTTRFSVVNSLNRPVDVRIDVFSNWGISLLTLPLTLQPHAVQSVDLADWLVHGKLPGRTLTAEDLAHLKAALCGERSPKDKLYYASEFTAGFATGYVTLRTQGNRPDALWGEYFVVDPQDETAQGDTLVNIDTTTGCPGLCERHLLRFLTQNPDLAADTKVVIWTGRTGQPSSTALTADDTRQVEADALVFNDQGLAVDARKIQVLPVQRVSIEELGLSPTTGWVDLQMEVVSFVGLSYGDDDLHSVALQAYCAPQETNNVPGPGIRLRKLTNGEDANLPPGPSILVGGAVTWTYEVENVGKVHLSNIQVTDDKGVAVTCPDDELAPGASMTCTGNGTAVACQYSNTGTVTAEAPDGVEIGDEDVSHYFGLHNAVLEVETLVNGQDADTAPGPTLTPGQPVSWTYVVTNKGAVRLADIQVTDDKGVVVTCPRQMLRPGESMTCTASGNAGQVPFTNTGTATGNPPCGPAVNDSDPAHYTVPSAPPPAPGIDIEKHTNGQDADTPTGPQINVGSPVLWEYFVTNTGNVALSNVQVTDNKGVAVSCPQTSLAAGASMRCTGNGTAVAGQYSNLGTAAGTSPQGVTVTDSDPSHYFGKTPPPPTENPCIKIEKKTNGHDADSAPGPYISVGSSVLWEYYVSNTGDVALSNVQVTDDKGVAVSCPQTSLAAGASMRCTGNGTATAGQYKNIGTATGTSPQGKTVTDSDPSHYYGKTPPPTGDQGCTPGYWKNHEGSWPATGYSTSQKVISVFQKSWYYPGLAYETLHEALSFQGGSSLEGAAGNLLRAAVAGLLDAAHPNVNYPRSPSALINDVNDALASKDRNTILALASAIDKDNNLGCPLN